MYHKYHTSGFVLANFNSGEASKIYKIFTRELGLIYARAQSARAPHSKLKPALTDYSVGRFTFIKGKNGWKITDAFTFFNLYFLLSWQSKEKVLFVSRFSALLLKLLPADQSNPLLFDVIRNDIHFLLENELTGDNLRNFECIAVLKLLDSLGYLGEGGPWRGLLSGRKISPGDLDVFSSWRRAAIKEINQSLRASQLI